jgi:hypothetical protein
MSSQLQAKRQLKEPPLGTMNHTIKEHFENRAPEVKATYAAILREAKKLGPFREEAKKTSIHLVRKSAFAGVATRKTALILTLKSDADVANQRIVRREQASAKRWHLEVKLETPEQVDRELADWLRKAYELAA